MYKMSRGECDMAYLNEVKQRHLYYRRSVLKYLKKQPSHYQYLKKRIYV